MRMILILAALFVFANGSVRALDSRAGPIEIASPWTRATPQGATVAGGYLTLTNRGTESERLLGGTFEAASKVEVHSMSMEDGVMRMRPVPGGLEIRPGETVELKPGGFHLMFMGLKQRLQPGQRIRATLTFEKAGSTEIEFAVQAMGGAGGHDGGSH